MKWPHVIRARYRNGSVHTRYLGVIAWGTSNVKRRTLSELIRLRDQIDMLLQQETDDEIEAGITKSTQRTPRYRTVGDIAFANETRWHLV